MPSDVVKPGNCCLEGLRKAMMKGEDPEGCNSSKWVQQLVSMHGAVAVRAVIKIALTIVILSSERTLPKQTAV